MVKAVPPWWLEMIGVKSPSQEALKAAGALGEAFKDVGTASEQAAIGVQAFVGKYPWETGISEWQNGWESVDLSTELPLVNAAFTMKDGPPPTCTYSADIFNPVDDQVKHLSVTIAYTAHIVTGNLDYLEYIKQHLKKAMEVKVAMEEQKIAAAMAEKPHALYESVYAPSGAIMASGGWYAQPKTIKELFAESDSSNSHQGLAQKLRKQAPGLNEAIDYPCNCSAGVGASIWAVIQHLNDGHHPARKGSDQWTRERIADWLEALDVDLTINTLEES